MPDDKKAKEASKALIKTIEKVLGENKAQAEMYKKMLDEAKKIEDKVDPKASKKLMDEIAEVLKSLADQNSALAEMKKAAEA